MKQRMINENNKIKRIAMYVIYDQDGILDGYRKYYLQELRKFTDTIVAVVSGTLTPESRIELETLADDILVRENKGLLAGSWIDGIQHIGWDKLYQYDELLMLNDSFFGPFYPLDEMFDAIESSDADFYGAFKNYEEKIITHINNHPMKHGWLRGSIFYFYVIKKHLLHSNDFRNYWTQKPIIKNDTDTYFFAEFDFYDYVIDHGYKVDAYQSDKLKGYMFDNLTHNMHSLVEEDKIPFARIRPFGTNMKDQSILLNYGKDPRQTFEYISKHTNYDENLIWDYILRTKNLTDIYNQLQLEYVIPKFSLEKDYTYNKPIAVILHIYYEDLVEKMASYCINFPSDTFFYITTTKEKVENKIQREFKKYNLKFKCIVRPNVGVAISTLWITYADIVMSDKYEYICYFHDKKSPYTTSAISGEQFGKRCYDNLFGTKYIVKNIINLFEDNQRLGLLGAPVPYHGMYFDVAAQTWKINFENTVNLAKRLNLKININKDIVPIAPYGDMFWFRSKALKKAIGYGFKYDDFNFKYEPDGTILHAIERIYAFAVQDSGYYYATIINNDDARSDLINYQYMISTLCSIFRHNGHMVYNFDIAKQVAEQYKGQPLTLKLYLKMKIKNKTPRLIWEFARKIYHTFK